MPQLSAGGGGGGAELHPYFAELVAMDMSLHSMEVFQNPPKFSTLRPYTLRPPSSNLKNSARSAHIY